MTTIKICLVCEHCEIRGFLGKHLKKNYYCTTDNAKDMINGNPLRCKDCRESIDLCGRSGKWYLKI